MRGKDQMFAAPRPLIGITPAHAGKSDTCPIRSGDSRDHPRACGEKYGWLTTGQGEMFVNTDDVLGGIVDSIMQGDNALAKSIFKGFAQFDENDWARLRDLIDKFLAGAVPAEIMERYMDDAAIQRMEDGLGKNNAAFMYGYAVGLGEREKKEKDGDQ